MKTEERAQRGLDLLQHCYSVATGKVKASPEELLSDLLTDFLHMTDRPEFEDTEWIEIYEGAFERYRRDRLGVPA